ncbi:hypothetical protein LguiA_020594 [Lonicera macranthoides]
MLGFVIIPWFCFLQHIGGYWLKLLYHINATVVESKATQLELLEMLVKFASSRKLSGWMQVETVRRLAPFCWSKTEIEQCYELIHKLGRGVVYLATLRIGSDQPHYKQTLELGREASFFNSHLPFIFRSGPGLMDAATQGALQAGKPVGGFTIAKEAGEWTASNFHPYLPAESYLTCSIKHGLVDAVVCSSSSEDSCSCSPRWDWHPRQVFRDSIVDSTRKG